MGSPGGSEVKASARNAGDPGSISGSGKIPWRRKWQPTPVFLPGEAHGRRSLVGYSLPGSKESDTTERLHFHFHLKTLEANCASTLNISEFSICSYLIPDSLKKYILEEKLT